MESQDDELVPHPPQTSGNKPPRMNKLVILTKLLVTLRATIEFVCPMGHRSARAQQVLGATGDKFRQASGWECEKILEVSQVT